MKMAQAEAGKGSKPRQDANQDAFADGWERIFGKAKREKALDELVALTEDMGLYEEPKKEQL
jgi:hypothetical protein